MVSFRCSPFLGSVMVNRGSGAVAPPDWVTTTPWPASVGASVVPKSTCPNRAAMDGNSATGRPFRSTTLDSDAVTGRTARALPALVSFGCTTLGSQCTTARPSLSFTMATLPSYSQGRAAPANSTRALKLTVKPSGPMVVPVAAAGTSATAVGLRSSRNRARARFAAPGWSVCCPASS
ncbi:hypothetical protein GCM10020229_20950 [Kitasatospora albolonga]